MLRVDSVLNHLSSGDRLKSCHSDYSAITGHEKHYKEGQLLCRYFLLRGKLQFRARIWYKDGQIAAEEYYAGGLLHGVRREWYPTGVLMSETTYKNGLRDGIRKIWHENKALKCQCVYRQDKLDGERIIRSQTGRIIWEEKYRTALRHGITKKWNNYGKLVYKTIYLRGREITGDIYGVLNSGKLDARYILMIENVEVRRFCLEELGYGKFLVQSEHEILDESGENTLIRINWHQQEEPVCLIKVKCPSTEAFYVLRVPPEMKTVKQAISWTFGLNAKEYLPEYET